MGTLTRLILWLQNLKKQVFRIGIRIGSPASWGTSFPALCSEFAMWCSFSCTPHFISPSRVLRKTIFSGGRNAYSLRNRLKFEKHSEMKKCWLPAFKNGQHALQRVLRSAILNPDFLRQSNDESEMKSQEQRTTVPLQFQNLVASLRLIRKFSRM